MGGPHPSFSDNIRNPNPTHFGLGLFFTEATMLYRQKWMAAMSVPLIGNKEIDASVSEDYDECLTANRAPRNLKLHQQIEDAGTEVTYRCLECRGCKKCKNSGRIESISIEEEVENALIDNSVIVHPDKG